MALDDQIQALATRIGNLLGATPAKGASSVSRRLDAIDSLNCPHLGVISGQYHDNSFHGNAPATLIGVANRIQLAPYSPPRNFSIDRIGCGVSTGVAGALFRVVVYASGADGWPSTLLYESGDLSGATATFVEATMSLAFSAGLIYWVGVRHSSTCTLRTIALASAINLGLLSNNATAYATVLQRTVAFASAAPSPWNFVNADRVAGVTPPSIRMRAA